MLSMFLVEELETELQINSNQSLIYFFCSFSDDRLNSATAILSSFIYQLIQKHRSMGRHATASFSSQNRTSETLRSVTALWKIFNRILNDPNLGKVFCILDGLDECDVESQDFLIDSFAALTTASSENRSHGMNLAIISRELSRPSLQHLEHVRLDPKHNTAFRQDVSLFIAERLQELAFPGLDESFRRELLNKLSNGAQGTFLWIGYITKELFRSKSRAHAAEILRNLPQDLYGIYGRILSSSIAKQSARTQMISFLLHAITLACRPFTIKELETLCMLEFGGNTTYSSEAVSGFIALCGDFLRLQSPSERRNHCVSPAQTILGPSAQHTFITLFHESAKKYLLRPQPDDDPVLEKLRVQDKKDGHLKLAHICLQYIRTSCLREIAAPCNPSDSDSKSTNAGGPPSTEHRLKADGADDPDGRFTDEHANSQESSTSIARGPLFQYAAHHWAVHARKARQHCSELICESETTSFFSENSSVRVNWIRWYKECSYGNDRPECRTKDIHHYMLPEPTMDQLPLACALGIEAWVNKLLPESESLFRHGDWTKLLHSAIINNHRAVVTILHRKGADINTEGLPGHQDYPITVSTPLMIACALKLNKMVDHLIGLGANVNLLTKSGQTALDFVRQRKRIRKSLLPILLRGCAKFDYAEIDKSLNISVDPLSLPASVIGLGLTAATIHKALYEFTSSVINVPKSACQACVMIEEISLAIIDIKLMMDGNSKLSSEQRKGVRLDHLTVVFQCLIWTLSRLEYLILSDINEGLMNRQCWLEKEAMILELLSALERPMSCLSLMFSIVTGYVIDCPLKRCDCF